MYRGINVIQGINATPFINAADNLLLTNQGFASTFFFRKKSIREED